MGTPIAVPAINTLLQYGDGNSPPAYTTVANVSDINGLSLAATVQDVTSHSTTVPWREKITTLLDAGDLTTKVYFVPDDAGHRLLLSFFTARDQVSWRLVFPDQDATKYTFQGYISKFSQSEPVAGVIEAAMTITATGQPNFLA